MNSIIVENINKGFRVYHDKGQTLKEKLLFRNRNYYQLRQVLKDVSFSIKKGEVVGIVGSNGCGKSTLLKLLTKIMYPDTGSISTVGRVASLIELGAGFHPDMSGKENIYTNASIFGLSRKEIDKRLSSIIKFSELEEFIDNPVRTYSSGMYMKLAFSVAINVDADILLIDEILAVGDANFQLKCFDWLVNLKNKGTTIVIVSHDLGQIEKICDKSIWIKEGVIEQIDKPVFVHKSYLRYMRGIREYNSANIVIENKTELKNNELAISEKANTPDVVDSLDKTRKRFGNNDVSIREVRIYSKIEEGIEYIYQVGDELNIEIDYEAKKSNILANFGFAIYTTNGVLCYGTNTLIEKGELVTISSNGTIKAQVKDLRLLNGEYLLDVAIYGSLNQPLDDYPGYCRFIVENDIKKDVGISRLDTVWYT